VSLLRLAMVMTGDRPTAEDVVQDAFLGPQRRWDHLSHTDSALRYLRSSVLNGCRSVFRRRGRQADRSGEGTAGASAESAAILGEEHREVLSALRRLPPRQRQVLTLRFYLELPIPEIARTMGISQGTVKSTTSRALAALGRLLREDQ
jgi:RNA polymerase sigma-70 factor (sigma-E family)